MKPSASFTSTSACLGCQGVGRWIVGQPACPGPVGGSVKSTRTERHQPISSRHGKQYPNIVHQRPPPPLHLALRPPGPLRPPAFSACRTTPHSGCLPTGGWHDSSDQGQTTPKLFRIASRGGSPPPPRSHPRFQQRPDCFRLVVHRGQVQRRVPAFVPAVNLFFVFCFSGSVVTRCVFFACTSLRHRCFARA